MKTSSFLAAAAMPGLAAAGEPAAAVPKLVPAVGWAQWSAALALVLCVLLAFLWLLKRMSGVGGAGSGHFRILGGVSLGTRERAVLLQAGGKQLVLGVSPGRIETLCVLEGEERVPVEPPPGEVSGFAAQLRGVMEKGKQA